MRWMVLLAWWCAAVLPASELFPDAGSLINPGMKQESFSYGHVERTWWRYLSRKHDWNRAVPLMIVLHGGFSSALGMSSLTEHGFEQIADKSDLVVLYPESVDKNWHDDRTTIESVALSANIDDIGFLRALIKQTEDETPIDPKRIFVCGISNGALMCYRIAREMPDVVAAVAPVAGLLPVEAKQLPWKQPVSLLLIQGNLDPLMPFAGGIFGSPAKPRGIMLSAEDTVRFLLEQDHLSDQIRELPSGDHASDGFTSWRATAYGRDQCEVDVYTVIGGGHTWPGGRSLMQEQQVGRTCMSLNACTTIWDFCMLHPRP